VNNLRYNSIRGHLRPYSIVGRRRTTINHAFASAIAPCDAFDEVSVRETIVLLGQNPDLDLQCSYCGALAETGTMYLQRSLLVSLAVTGIVWAISCPAASLAIQRRAISLG